MATEKRRSTLDLRYLDPEQVGVRRGPDGRVRATIADEFSVIDPVFLRSHPLSAPDRYISIRGRISQEGGEQLGGEYGLLRQWRRLDPESREIVEAELARRYLCPRVLQILAAREYSGAHLCLLATDRGKREVTLRDVRDNVVYLGTDRVLITDAEGNRYDIPDISRLDRLSRARLSRIL